jgi:nitrogenase molybdenum-iron protein alpha/beta subunit
LLNAIVKSLDLFRARDFFSIIVWEQKREVLYMATSHSTYMCREGHSCGLTGAAAFFAGIPNAAIVLNSSLWCYFSAQGYVEKQCPSARVRFFCSQRNKDTVFRGTEEYLLHILQSIKQNSEPSVVLLANSCADNASKHDLVHIAKQANMNCPAICLDRQDLEGGFWVGYQAAAKAYYNAVPLQPRSLIKPNTVNLLGCSVGYYNAVYDLKELRRMLTLAGYEVLACPGAGSTTQEISKMSQAQLNIVVHDELGRNLAELLEEQYDIPYVSLLPPYGLQGSSSWLKAIDYYMSGESNGLTTLQKEANHLEQNCKIAIKEQQKTWGNIWFDSIFIAAPSSIAFGISQAIRSEWLDTKKIITVLHNGVPFKRSYPEYVGTVLDGYKDQQRIEQQLTALTGGLLMASSREKAVLHQKAVEDVAYQHISLPVYDEMILKGRPFMGLQGSSHMVEELWNKYIQEKSGICKRVIVK